MKSYFVLITGLFLLFSSLSTGSAAILQVPEEYKTIQEAIEKAKQGDKIHQNAQAGIGLRSNAKGTIWENRIYHNIIGIGCLDLADVQIESNEIYENFRVGIGLMGCMGKTVTIRNNFIHDNRFLSISPNPGCDLVQSGNRF